MTAITHITSSVALGRVLGISWFSDSFWYALIFGFGIDFTQVVKFPLMMKKHGVNLPHHYRLRLPLEEFSSLGWVIPLSFYIRSWIPVIFFCLHVFLDYIVPKNEKRPFLPFSRWGFKRGITNTKQGVIILEVFMNVIFLAVIMGI